MRNVLKAGLLGAALGLGFTAAAGMAVPATAYAVEVEIPYEEFTLDNGLRVVVHEDRKAPVVAVSIWYHVGSKDEPEGRSGFAHLFEHLMFNGSENYDDDWFKPLEEVGATGLNGTTSFDRTNYFQTVPTPALDRVLWMESDRMGHLLGAIDQDKLDEQRDVVKNEKRQGENQPYGQVFNALVKGLFPNEHPYSHTVIGSMDDLDAASLEDVQGWFEQYYGPDNSVLVLAGDIDVETAKPLVEKYFGDIEAGPPLSKMKKWVPERTVNTYETMYDRVPQTRIYRFYAVPGRTTRIARELEVAARVLGDGKTSRMYKELVYDQKIATSASVFSLDLELTNVFGIVADVKEGVDVDLVKREMDKVMAEFLEDGPTRNEVAVVKTKVTADIVRGLEQVGGFGGKAVTLASGAIYADNPGFYQQRLDWINATTPKSTLAAAKKWLNEGYYELTVMPFPERSNAAAGVDRTTGLPAVDSAPDLAFPEIETGELENGMQVVFARRSTIPVVEMAIQFDAGFAADQGAKLGTASFATAMMDEGTRTRDALEISAEADRLGAELGSGSSLDTTQLTLSALKENLDDSVELAADIIRNPAFAQSEIDRVRPNWLAQIQQEKAQPVSIALRLLPGLMYGDDHAYGVPFTGSGTVESINSLTRADLVKFHRDWLRPDNATIFVVGDTTLPQITRVLNKHFGDWDAPSGAKPTKNVADVEVGSDQRVIIVDRPGSPQSMILAGHVAPPTGADNTIAIDAMNDVLGGTFTARVNMNLREEKGWSYGARTLLIDAAGKRPFIAFAPVQTDKTADSMAEIRKELLAYTSDRPATEEELTRVVLNNTRSLPGRFETSGSVLGSLLSSDRFGRPYDYPAGLTEAYRSLDLDDINAAAKEVLQPDGMIWVIIGDRSQIEEQVGALGFAEIEIRDVDGNLVE